MGVRVQQLACTDCQYRWWVAFDHKTRAELRRVASTLPGAGERCPECDSNDWKLTDATEFAGGLVHTTDEYCPECAYDAPLTVVLRCASQHEFVVHEAESYADVPADVDADLDADRFACPSCDRVGDVERFDNYCCHCGAPIAAAAGGDA